MTGKASLAGSRFWISVVVLLLSASANAAHVAAAEYVIYQDGEEIVAVSGKTGETLTRNGDASTVIQAAIGALPRDGGKVYLGAGSYTLTTTLSVKNRNGIHIEGAARGMQHGEAGGTILRSDRDIDLLEVWGEKFRVFGVTVSNLQLWGSGKDNGKAGLEVSDNDQYGIHIESPDNNVQRIQGVKILNTTAVRNRKGGIYVGSNVEDLSITGGSDIGGTREGPAIEIDGRLTDGFAPFNILVGNAHLYNNADYAIRVGRANHVLIQGNIITQHRHRVAKIKGQQHGVLIENDASHVLLSGNILSGFEADAIRDASGRAVLSGNLIDDEPRRQPKKAEKN